MTPRKVHQAPLPFHPSHPLEWLRHQYCNTWKGEDSQDWGHVTDISQLCSAGHVSRMNHHLSGIILCCKLSTGYYDREAPKKWYKYCSKNPLVSFTSTIWYLSHRPLSTLHSENKHVVYSFENTHRADLKDEVRKSRNRNTMPSSPNQIFSSSHCEHAWSSHIFFISHEHSRTLDQSAEAV